MKRDPFAEPRGGDVVVIGERIVLVVEVLHGEVRYKQKLPPRYDKWGEPSARV